MPEFELPNARPEERLLVATLIDFPDLYGQLTGLLPKQFTDSEAKKILLKMRKMRKTNREWMRSDFPILVDSVGTPLQPAPHLQFPELVQRIRDTDFRRESYLIGAGRGHQGPGGRPGGSQQGAGAIAGTKTYVGWTHPHNVSRAGGNNPRDFMVVG